MWYGVRVPNRHLSAFGAALLIPIPVPLQCLFWRLFNPNLGAVNLDPNAFNTSDPNISPHITIWRVRSKSPCSYPTLSPTALSPTPPRHPGYRCVTSHLVKSSQNGLHRYICSHHFESRQAIGIQPRHCVKGRRERTDFRQYERPRGSERGREWQRRRGDGC